MHTSYTVRKFKYYEIAIKALIRASDRVQKKIKNYAENFGNTMNEKHGFRCWFGRKNFKMISLLIIFACEDSKQLLDHLYGAIFQFYAEKCPEDAEDGDVSKLSGSTTPHPVRCPVL